MFITASSLYFRTSEGMGLVGPRCAAAVGDNTSRFRSAFAWPGEESQTRTSRSDWQQGGGTGRKKASLWSRLFQTRLINCIVTQKNEGKANKRCTLRRRPRQTNDSLVRIGFQQVRIHPRVKLSWALNDAKNASYLWEWDHFWRGLSLPPRIKKVNAVHCCQNNKIYFTPIDHHGVSVRISVQLFR